MTNANGSCLCGAVHYEVEGTFGAFYLCHCSYCRKDTGSAHAANLFASPASLSWLSGEDEVTVFQLPDTMHVKAFCRRCGSALPNQQLGPEIVMVPAGSLDSPVPRRPTAHIFTRSRAQWDHLLEQAPSVSGSPAISIRPETGIDGPAIHALTAAAFADMPFSSHTEHYIVDALRSAGALSISLVAERGGNLVGHVAVSPVNISDTTTDWYGLGPISVSPESQGQGIGAALMHAALEGLEQLGARGCVLLGDPGYYHRFGFTPRPGLVLSGVPAEYFQAVSFTGTVPQGTVSYHPAFDVQG